ncbi:MAG: type 1 glutamine amidotransferase [Methanoregulaceae archaeon]|jgi:GMP synthase-like glutamine amidotransferase|nr:type 1 glutamine amidotransferase [Methanoregulaceae archaeon]MCU0629244.1 type 1 glutamine amidotransferase [Methanoregulaceae archaeon]
MQQREVTILQHVRNEHGGLFEEYILERGIGLYRVPIDETNEIPPINSTHLLILGGPMSVNNEEEFPWLKEEKQVIREWVAKGRPVLGICLGAQLIASSFGAAVRPCEEELGWSSVITVRDDFFPDLPGQFRVFQMHGETFEIPHEAELIFHGEKVCNQGICIGSAAGLQFHIELTIGMIQEWVITRPDREQSFILAQSRQYLPESRKICRIITDRFLSAAPYDISWIRKSGYQ